MYSKNVDSLQVVRVGTESYKRGNTYYLARTVRRMERMSNNSYDLLKDEVDMVGMHDTMERIVNLQSVPDGLYYLVLINIFRDCESGHIEDFDMRLVPYGQQV